MASLFVQLVLLSIFFQGKIIEGKSNWSRATATLYSNISDSKGGACGYNIINANRKDSTEISEALFAEGAACGQCYKIKCDSESNGYKSCIKGSSVIVIATSFFPMNYYEVLSEEKGLKPATEHFHISPSMWKKISSRPNGVVPVLYQRVPCIKQGGVQFTISGKEFFLVVLISNVAGDGSIKSVSIKGSISTKWNPMSRNIGAYWQSNICLKGQSISFSVTLTDGQNIVFNNVVPVDWSFGKTFSSPLQFNY
ncbi:hypothetical protein LUZ60_016186 [Juncus effusus]|nr:hypothetical protein LUZ60_016186 [Juncus effusus]